VDHRRDHDEDDETRKLEQEVQKLQEVRETEIRDDAKRLDVQRYNNIRELMTRDEHEQSNEAKPLPRYEGNDAEARRWNTEKEAIESYRDSSTERGIQGSNIARHMYDASDNANSADIPKSHETGKILSDDREPGVSTHLHKHDSGVTISTKDQNTGKVERYNFNTGEGFEKSVSDMTPKEQQRRMRSEHTQANPNPDRDTIPGFHSSVWDKSEAQ
jgi:hypothetical protein